MKLPKSYYQAVNSLFNRTGKRKCEICGDIETPHNLMLKYDNGKIMCDNCMIEFYNKQEQEQSKNV